MFGISLNPKFGSRFWPIARSFSHPLTTRPIPQKLKLSPTSSQVRQDFIDYFVIQNDHQFVRSSPVKPVSTDNSLLFVNAGMNQFKPIFLDQLDRQGFGHLRELRRVANSQKCIRVGGKHCDLETVGTDFTHHTFFEMLGNWSFNDYFKKEACEMAWTLLTKVYRIDPSRLFVTIFGGNEQLGLQADLEAYDIWRSIGVPSNRIIPLGIKDNFWEMGETGPCGICTEIHYQFGNLDNNSPIQLENSVEIWNIVFMQYFRDQNGQLNRLEKNFIDTGMGLERILSLVQNVANNYSTDLFVPYFNRLEQLCHWPSYSNRLDSPIDVSYRILADHIRMATISIADQIVPDDRGAGYLLRRVIRRAIESIRSISSTHQLPHNLSESQVILALAQTAIESLGGAFPELEQNSNEIEKILDEEVRLYVSAIVRDGRIMKLANNLCIGLCEEPKHNQAVIGDKLELIYEQLNEIQNKWNKGLKLEKLSEQSEMDKYRGLLNQLKQLISTDHSMATRFGLTSDSINARYKQTELLLISLEEQCNQVLSQLIATFELYAARPSNHHSDQFKVLSMDFAEFSHLKQHDQHLDYLLLKISLDLFGDKPLAILVHIGAQQSISGFGHFLVQQSVPGGLQKSLQADTWFEQALNSVPNLKDQLTLKPIPTKRVHKLVKFHCQFKDQNPETHSDLIESLRLALIKVGESHLSATGQC